MSFFNLDIPLKQKEESHHPWEKRIKAVYSKTYKYSHNSTNNPIYPTLPKKKEKKFKSRIKFTVIGNRVTKDFIYCYYLVKGLHKYRKKEFEAPVIRGVTSVEWPRVLSDLKRQYGGLTYLVSSGAVVLIGDEALGGREELKKYVQSKYHYHVTLDYVKEGIHQFANYIKSSGRPCAYLNISVDGDCIGSLIFMLYSDLVPLTCENFLRLCEVTKAGYAGTQIHRIVKDSWIQCGGYGLKDNPTLGCENFIVPHDSRGVLCMANDGRHNDCSTQFFILLQPATWMAGKYVAFGQLIEGEETLNKIENVPTWHESPTDEIVIYKAGVFNMDCQHVPINKNAGAYLQGHVENLLAVGEIFYEELIKNVFVEVQLNYLRQLEALRIANEGAEEDTDSEIYRQKGAAIRKQLEELRKDDRSAASASAGATDNNEFDVDEYEIEEYSYKHVSVVAPIPSSVVKPEKIFYIPFTDVPYPGEIDSTIDFKKKLIGNYCHEADLEKDKLRRQAKPERLISIPPEALGYLFETYNISDDDSDISVNGSDEKMELSNYFQDNTDKTSFAGPIIKKMAHKRKKYDIFDQSKEKELKHDLFTDEELRIFRTAKREYTSSRKKKVSIALSSSSLAPSKIKRRQTGFIRPTDLHKIHELIRKSSQNLAMLFNGDEESDDKEDSEIDEDELFRKIRIAPTALTSRHRNTHSISFAPRSDLATDHQLRPSVLVRLYDELNIDSDEELPTLKYYKNHITSYFFTPLYGLWLQASFSLLRIIWSDLKQYCRNYLLINKFNTRRPLEKMQPTSYLLKRRTQLNLNGGSRVKRSLSDLSSVSIDHVLDLQHGKQFRKISSDYVRTINTLERTMPDSIRSVEYSKIRPSLSVLQYRLQNEQNCQRLREKAASEAKAAAATYTKC